MQQKRLALVAMKFASEGPWARAKGNEQAVQITHLLEGEQVRFDMTIGDLSDSISYDQPGLYPLPFKRMERYRVSKTHTLGSPTTVEIVLDGTT